MKSFWICHWGWFIIQSDKLCFPYLYWKRFCKVDAISLHNKADVLFSYWSRRIGKFLKHEILSRLEIFPLPSATIWQKQMNEYKIPATCQSLLFLWEINNAPTVFPIGIFFSAWKETWHRFEDNLWSETARKSNVDERNMRQSWYRMRKMYRKLCPGRIKNFYHIFSRLGNLFTRKNRTRFKLVGRKMCV